MALPASSDDYEVPRLTPAVLWLVAANVAIYFVQLTLQRDFPTLLGFQFADVRNGAPWTALTYMFVHAGFWHLAVNMYMLWALGPRVERAMGTRAFVFFYAFCGLGGVVFQSLFVPHEALLVGASAAIFGVLVAYAMRWPNEEMYLFLVVPMKMRWFALFLVALNLAAGALSAGSVDGGGVAYLAHLGGAAFGLLYLLRPSAPSVDRLRQRVATAPDLGDEPPRPVPRSLPRPRERQSEVDEVVEQSKALTMNKPPRPVVPAPPRPTTVTAASRREALDLVLDKISQHGLDSLTLEERHLLEEMSRKLRNNSTTL
ncbi:Peptidase S54, rhomboid domain protein [Gemmatirosa kalamazoonensis]|uniref:Peptidase S54, rhomboid domain protein n=1 Tax=Gemmatirosa kalamazoonensis TaxID=861299 RepID=W0RDB3_9BACT|nr:rhomboid family intramembrane serine protease [Gemmatirosa kalamazoonensis]AHG88432.1 Peptidase S54, rhomboid domain protein [Gemmatirosa kalamazoonensis]